jgi:hypothetical protein
LHNEATTEAVDWLVHTDAGLWTRIAIGVGIFSILGITDLVRMRSGATRWKEYAVLLVAVLAALFYGAINDQITSSISWEYFYYGKELEHVLGPTIPPDSAGLHWEAAKVGLKATWSAGLIFGVVLLLANNPFRNWPRLKNRQLVRMLPIILLTAAGFAVVGGILGYEGALTHFNTDFEDMVRADVFRPHRFICTWGVHLGGYVGGFVGTFIAAGMIIYKRIHTTGPSRFSGSV